MIAVASMRKDVLNFAITDVALSNVLVTSIEVISLQKAITALKEYQLHYENIEVKFKLHSTTH